MRRRTYSPPNARPKMKALSMSSNECVELPSTRLSMRIQPISYMNDAAPVRKAATVNQPSQRSVPGRGGGALPAALMRVLAGRERSPRPPEPMPILRSPAVRMVPGRPTAC